MKGIVFNLLQEVVRREHGEDFWDDLLDETGLSGVYTSLGSYPHDELIKVVAAAAHRLGKGPDEVVRWFGRGALGILAEKFPAFFVGHDGTRSFIMTLNDVIHPEVRKTYPGADVPVFDFDASTPGVLSMGYVSKRQLCSFAEGLIDGAAQYFGEDVDQSQTTCMKRGDPKCVFRLAFRKRAIP